MMLYITFSEPSSLCKLRVEAISTSDISPITRPDPLDKRSGSTLRRSTTSRQISQGLLIIAPDDQADGSRMHCIEKMGQDAASIATV
jgi:hypothetical protein